MNRLSREEKLIGAAAVQRLKNASALIVGVGGVGGYALEMLARAGLGHITVVDDDEFSETNLNRQILCLESNIGKPKVEAAAKRVREINSDIVVTPLKCRYNSENSDEILGREFDYVVDCIDSVADKVCLIKACKAKNLRIISACGAGNRLNPNFVVMDIAKTTNDGLAKAVRKALGGLNISLNVVCDTNAPLKIDGTPASISYAPAIMGCVMAQKIIEDLICGEKECQK